MRGLVLHATCTNYANYALHFSDYFNLCMIDAQSTSHSVFKQKNGIDFHPLMTVQIFIFIYNLIKYHQTGGINTPLVRII